MTWTLARSISLRLSHRVHTPCVNRTRHLVPDRRLPDPVLPTRL